MRSILGSVAGVLLLGAATVASAQSIETGTVVRIDPQSKVVILDDGRMYRVTANTVLVVDNQRAPFTALSPGQRVVIQSGEVVALRGGQYVAVSSGPAVVAQAPGVVDPGPGRGHPGAGDRGARGVASDVSRNGHRRGQGRRSEDQDAA